MTYTLTVDSQDMPAILIGLSLAADDFIVKQNTVASKLCLKLRADLIKQRDALEELGGTMD